MGLRTGLWYLRDAAARAGDLSTIWRLMGHDAHAPLTSLCVRLNGRSAPLAIRSHTRDLWMVNQILRVQSEYRLPSHVSPRTILDIGANIGLTSVYFALTYPEARIWSFEPFPDNIALLERNTSIFRDRITVVPTGLGKEHSHLPFFTAQDAVNFGGGAFYETSFSHHTPACHLPVVPFSHAMTTYQIPLPDVVKIDTEGAEWDVLQGMPTEVIRHAQVVVGELHSIHDEQVLGYLGQTHEVTIDRVTDHTSGFTAVRR